MKLLFLYAVLAASALAGLTLPAIAKGEEPTAAQALAGNAAEVKKAAIGVPESTSPMGIIAAGLIVAACGGLAVWAKRKQKLSGPDGEAIRVVGTKSLGGRSSLMLISARGRDVLLSVNEKGATLLVEWPGGQETTEVAIEEPVFEAPKVEEAPVTASSAAVSGLVRLRQQTQPRIAVPEGLKSYAAAAAPPAPRVATNAPIAPAAFPELFNRELRKGPR